MRTITHAGRGALRGTARGVRGAGTVLRRLVLFGWLQARACAFAVALFAGMAASTLLPPLPVARYDLLLAYGVLLTGVGHLLGWETRREIAVVAVCRVLGLAFELVKVRVGSWSYPRIQAAAPSDDVDRSP